ncbi:MAG: hypothetical protein JST96_07530 [Bacteroidetes bacterium]|nr:hypothetical protein [Bacteroidota bacterium]
MRKYLLNLSIVIILFSCNPSTRIIRSWRAPDAVVNTSRPAKFMIAALLKNETVRRRTEDLMLAYYPERGIASYKELGVRQLKEPEAFYTDKLLKDGIDIVVIVRMIKYDKKKIFAQGQWPAYYNNWKEYYNFASPAYYTPDFYAIDKLYNVEVNIYALATNKLIWTGITSTMNSSGPDDLFDDVINTIHDQLTKEGFLK